MPNPEKLNTPELSEEEKELQPYQEEIDDFKDELPLTKEEAKEAGNALNEWYKEFEKNPKEAGDALNAYLRESDKMLRPFIVLEKGIQKGIKDAKDAGLLKRGEKEIKKLASIGEKISKENPNELDNLLVRNDLSGEYHINPDGIFDIINSLDKEDRKFIKKTVKAILKTRAKEDKQDIKIAKEEAKRVKKARKALIVDKIN